MGIAANAAGVVVNWQAGWRVFKANRLARMDQRAGNFARHKLGAALNPRPDKTKGRESVDSARDKRTGDIIDAEQLWDLEVVDKEAY